MGTPEDRQNTKYIQSKNGWKYLKLGKRTDVQIHEAQRIPNRFNPNKTTLRHNKLSKVKKQRILKAEKEKINTRGPP